jgi:hypothetical protein
MVVKLVHQCVQDIAQPLLYQTIHLLNSTTIVRLVHTIDSSTSPIASWIRALHIPDFASYFFGAPSKNLIAVLEKAYNLRVLSLPQDLRPSVMEVVSRVSSSSLRTLSLTLNDISLPSLRSVGALKNLEFLELSIRDAYNPMSGDVSGWELPSLAALTVHAHDHSMTIIKFLGTCHFDHLKTLIYDVVYFEDEHTVALVRFLKRCIVLETLHIVVGYNEIFSAIPHSLRKLIVRGGYINTLYLVPSTITDIVLDGYYRLEPHEVLEVLNLVRKLKPDSLPNLRSIQIRRVVNHRSKFLWDDQPEGSEEVDETDENVWGSVLMKRLLRYSSELAPMGIDVLDGVGKTVSDYASAS